MEYLDTFWHVLLQQDWHMGRRGRKPTDISLLTVWEFEWYKAFHVLRDGTALPAATTPPLTLVPQQQIAKRLNWLQNASENELWREQRRLGTMPRDGEPLTLVDSAWLELQRGQEIAELRRYVPREIRALGERRQIWKDLISARNVKAVQDACRRWERLLQPGNRRHVKVSAAACWPAYVSVHAEPFLRMKRGHRFPSSDYAEDSRLRYLARGMAGVMVGVSPMTAIERLRNMKHEAGGACWNESEQRCNCWGCRHEEFKKLEQFRLTQQEEEK
jgi:hypothetical protein